MSLHRKETTIQKINFDSLKRLLSSEYQEDIDSPEFLEEVRLHSCYRSKRREKPSDHPQRVTLYSNSLKTTLYGRKFKDLEVSKNEIQATFANPRRTWWLDLQNPSEQDLRTLCAALRVHPLTIEDIMNQETREKIEDYGTYYYACIWSCRGLLSKQRTTYKPYSTYLVVFPTGTLTITFLESDHPAKVSKRIDLLKDYVSINSDWIFYAFMDDIVDSFTPLITRLEKCVDEIEDLVYITRHDDIQEFLMGIENTGRNVTSLIRLLIGKINILSTFEKHHCIKRVLASKNSSGHSLELYIADVQDHVDSLISKLRHFDSLLSRSRNNFVAALSIETIRTRQRLVFIIGRVSAGTMAFTAITVVNGLFGTNIGNGEGPKVDMYNAKPLTAFFAIGAGQVCLVILLLTLLKRYKWL